ncbi:hypothetical protein GXW71_10345 [Roseomonas hellenica]|uniref:Response regulatory domain-containing protein n=1 Tax=Plastoroseomonas hellenica TaxID=2687306 RepID=A0ABS5EWS9_9PROT|nr:hypothetical protein [Plastoroseomonas hellenica]MBR0664750.1 hypothetical protein [Plastoroseomonas hellenica]
MAGTGIARSPCILLVEGDPLITATTLRLMRHLGYRTLPPASTVAEARTRMLEKPDAVLLEISLRGGESSLPFADELMATGVPFAFFSGYYIHDLPARFASCRIVMKPVGDQVLTAELLALAGWPGGRPGAGAGTGEGAQTRSSVAYDLGPDGIPPSADPAVANDP